METNEKVSIRFKQQAYRLLKSQTLELHYVFAEFVDNSLASFILKKKELLEVNPNYKLRVTIIKNDDEIIIIDNAGGIGEDNFHRAFEPGHLPELNKGLNEFGMGLKNSSVWLADNFIVESSAIGEPFVKKVEFNYNEVIKNDIEELSVFKKDFDKNSSFTKITLTQTRQYKNWPRKKIQETLASIYRNQLLNKEMSLNVFGDELSFKHPEFLNAPIQKDYDDFINGKINIKPCDIEWKYLFDVPFGIDKRMSGFIAILDKMSGSGFSYFRRGRVIDGAGDEKQFPKSLSGQIGSPKYKRMYGELHFEGFEVDYKKTGIIQGDEVDILIGLLDEQLKTVKIGSNFYNFPQQAQDYRLPSLKTIESMTERIQKEVAKKIKNNSNIERKKEKINKAFEKNENVIEDKIDQKLTINNIPTDVLIEEYYSLPTGSKLLLKYCFKSLPEIDVLY